MVQSEHHEAEKSSREQHYYIASIDTMPSALLKLYVGTGVLKIPCTGHWTSVFEKMTKEVLRRPV
jgi:hypothetical protein